MALSRDDILTHVQDYETREVHVPTWKNADGDDVVLVRGLTGTEWDAHQASLRVSRPDGRGGVQEGVDNSNVSAKLIVRCIVDDTGKRVFTDQDASEVGKLPLKEINAIGEVILELSGMTEAAKEAIAGNSEAAPGGASSSA